MIQIAFSGKHYLIFLLNDVLTILALFQQRFGENVGQLLDPNHASMLKSAVTSGQPSGYLLLRTL